MISLLASDPTMASKRKIVKIENEICLVRGQRVLLDSDLAAVYGVTTRRLNEQLRRNRLRFPDDFAFQLTAEEFTNLKSQFATSRFQLRMHGGKRKAPRAFTEHGAIMAACVLNSPRAVQMSLYVVRAFVAMCQLLASNEQVSRRLRLLERSVAALDAETRKQFDQVYEAILGLMSPSSRRS